MTHEENLRPPLSESASAEIDRYFSELPDGAEKPLSDAEFHRLEKDIKALRKAGKSDEAMAIVWKALGRNESSPAFWIEAVSTLSALGRHAEALAAIETLLSDAPWSGHVWSLLGQVLGKHGKNQAAETAFRRALRLDPGNRIAQMWLAQWLTQLARYDEATPLFEDILRRDPDSLDAQAGLAQLMVSQGRLDEAEPMLRAVIDKKTDHLDARLGIARAALLRGDLEEGWPAYEWRRKRSDLKMPKVTGPEWDGSPLAGKTIVVYAEQGYGDVLQFVRYVPLMAAEGARVILLIPKELDRLCQCLVDVAEVRYTLSSLPAFDYHVPLLSVPGFFKTRLDSIPADIPYLDVPPAPNRKLPVPLGTRLKVGLVWAGRPTHANDRHRSQKIERFLPLAAIPGVTLYSLQAGPRTADIHKNAHPALVGDLSPHLKDFVDTAAVIKQLDLVIAVDTSVAHLAGALGKPVWVLIPYAPDWRWLLQRETTPWYPTMRLLRQSSPQGWDDVMGRIAADLRAMTANRAEAGTQEESRLVSLFADAGGKPRYRMRAPTSFLSDPGIRYLVERERAGIGYEYATRSFLDEHLQPGDLFIDAGAHWGIMSLHAATNPKGDVQVLACEPTPRNITHLRRWIDDNGLEERIELIPAALSDTPGRGGMLPQSTMGHSLEKAEDGAVEVTTIDRLLQDRPHLAGRRIIVKIDVEGTEADVIAGMAGALADGRVAAIIWERGRTYDQPANRHLVAAIRKRLSDLGFTAWRFAGEDKAGPLEPFVDGAIENVFELGAALRPAASYGDVRPVPPQQPEDPVFDKGQQASALFQKGLKLQSSGAVDKALSAYAHAATLDRRNPDLYNNLGVAMQRLGRLPAAEACYRLAAHLGTGNFGCLSNLGSALREQGKLAEAENVHRQILEAAPSGTRWLVNAGHAQSDLGRAAEAQALYERALAAEPNNADLLRDLADSLLRQGRHRDGLAHYDRYFARTGQQEDKTAPAEWTGEALEGRTILVEQTGDIEDALLFARFIGPLRDKGAGKVILRGRPAQIRLMARIDGVDLAVGDGDETPADCRARLTALPGLLGLQAPDTLSAPYLRRAPERSSAPLEGRLKLGIAWSGATSGKRVPLSLIQLMPLLDDPRYLVQSLQRGPAAADVAALTAGTLIGEAGLPTEELDDLAAAVQRMDIVLTADPVVAAIAGALAIPALALLPFATDWRWHDGTPGRSDWYKTVRLHRLPGDGSAEDALRSLSRALSGFADEALSRPAPPAKKKVRGKTPG